MHRNKSCCSSSFVCQQHQPRISQEIRIKEISGFVPSAPLSLTALLPASLPPTILSSTAVPLVTLQTTAMSSALLPSLSLPESASQLSVQSFSTMSQDLLPSVSQNFTRSQPITSHDYLLPTKSQPMKRQQFSNQPMRSEQLELSQPITSFKSTLPNQTLRRSHQITGHFRPSFKPVGSEQLNNQPIRGHQFEMSQPIAGGEASLTRVTYSNPSLHSPYGKSIFTNTIGKYNINVLN